MSEKHLFVNSSHYQDRPDSDMRHKIASHAAKYGPNGSLAFKTSFESADDQLLLEGPRRSLQDPLYGSPSTSRASLSRSSVATPSKSSFLQRDCDDMSASLSAFCICAEESPGNPPSEHGGTLAHTENCAILEDHLTLLKLHELPFRSGTHTRQSNNLLCASGVSKDGLVLHCWLVCGQTAIDSLDPTFENKPSRRILSLQQNALSAMRRAIVQSNNVIDDAIVIASALMLAVAAVYADQEAFKAHHSSLQKLIALQGGFNQTRAHVVVKALIGSGQIYLVYHQYMLGASTESSPRKYSSIPRFSAIAPFKLKYPMPPFTGEIAGFMCGMAPGLRKLAEISKFSVQALQLLHLISRWSSSIDENTKVDTNTKQCPIDAENAHGAHLLNIFDETVQTKRMAALLLVSLPLDTAHMRIERFLCLGLLNLLHSVTLQPHPIPLRDRLVIDFTEALFSLFPMDQDEEDYMIWLALAVASEWRHCASKLKDLPLLAARGCNGVMLGQMWLQKSRQVMDWLVIKYERTCTWDEITSICSHFLWLSRLGSEWKQTWREALERRLRNIPRKKSRAE